MSDFSQGSYLTVHFIDGTQAELKFISFHDSYFKGSNNAGEAVIVPFANVKYIVS